MTLHLEVSHTHLTHNSICGIETSSTDVYISNQETNTPSTFHSLHMHGTMACAIYFGIACSRPLVWFMKVDYIHFILVSLYLFIYLSIYLEKFYNIMEVCQSLHLSCSIIHGFIACQEKPQNEIVWCSDTQLVLPLTLYSMLNELWEANELCGGRLGPNYRWVSRQ